MKFALIKDNKVENLIEADNDFIELIKKDWDHCICIDDLPLGISIGWLYNKDDGFSEIEV